MSNGNLYLKKALALVKTNGYDGDAAFLLLKKAYEQGNAEAAYAIGTWYLFGKHVRKNFRIAALYLQRASDKGYASATYDLAICYEKGKGVEKNKHEAFSLYMKAALLGDQQAGYEVGRCFYWGIGTTMDRRAAQVWIERFSGAGEPKMAASAKPNALLLTKVK